MIGLVCEYRVPLLSAVIVAHATPAQSPEQCMTLPMTIHTVVSPDSQDEHYITPYWYTGDDEYSHS